MMAKVPQSRHNLLATSAVRSKSGSSTVGRCLEAFKLICLLLWGCCPKHLDLIVAIVGHIDVPVLAHLQTARFTQSQLLVARRAPRQQKTPRAVKLLHAIPFILGDIHVVTAIHGNPIGTIELAFFEPELAPFGEETTLPIKFLDPIIVGVGDK